MYDPSSMTGCFGQEDMAHCVTVVEFWYHERQVSRLQREMLSDIIGFFTDAHVCCGGDLLFKGAVFFASYLREP